MNEANYRVSEKCVVPEEWKTGIGDFGLWVRPAKMFFEEIEVGGRRMRRVKLGASPNFKDPFPRR